MQLPGFYADHAHARLLARRQAVFERERRTAPPQHLSALPCPNFYERYPERVGAVGNVVTADIATVEPWMLVARVVTRAEADKTGGCIIYTPPFSPASRGAKKKHAGAVCYCISDPDDVVYGRAAYLPRCEFTEDASIDKHDGEVISFASFTSEPFHSLTKAPNDEHQRHAILYSESALSLTSDSMGDVYYGNPIR